VCNCLKTIFYFARALIGSIPFRSMFYHYPWKDNKLNPCEYSSNLVDKLKDYGHHHIKAVTTSISSVAKFHYSNRKNSYRNSTNFVQLPMHNWMTYYWQSQCSVTCVPFSAHHRSSELEMHSVVMVHHQY